MQLFTLVHIMRSNYTRIRIGIKAVQEQAQERLAPHSTLTFAAFTTFFHFSTSRLRMA